MNSPVLLILLGIVAALLVLGLAMLMRRLSAKEAQLAELERDAEGLKKDRDQARQETRELQKRKEKLEADAQSLRDEQEGLKKELFKSRQETKAAASKGGRREPSTSEDREALARAMGDMERLREETQQLRDKVRTMEAEASRPGRAPAPAEAPVAPVEKIVEKVVVQTETDPRLVRQVNNLEGQVDRMRKELQDTKERLHSRERDLRAARKSSVSNDRAFRVTQGKLQALKEKLATVEGEQPAEDKPAQV